MANSRIDGRFSLVFLVFNGISNVLNQEREIQVFQNAACHLLPEGRFLIERGCRTCGPCRRAGLGQCSPPNPAT